LIDGGAVVMRQFALGGNAGYGCRNQRGIYAMNEHSSPVAPSWLRFPAMCAVFAVVCCLAACTPYHFTSATAVPITGDAVPELSSLDHTMQSLMLSYDIPGASLAVSYKGRLVYARGFGYADQSTSSFVQPTSTFRLASVTKVITGMAVSKLIEDGQLSLDDVVFGPDGILNDEIYQNIQDPRVLDIQLWHLLSHTSGFPGEGAGDPQYDYVTIADAMGATPPASNATILQYVLSHMPLVFAPGAQYLYSNVGYNALGRIIEKTTGQTYENYVRSLLAQIGVTDMFIAGSLENERRDGEVIYYDMPYCVGDMYDGSGRQVPCSYGTIYFPTIDSHGGWIASPIDLLKFTAAIDGFGNRPSLLTADTIDAMKEIPAGITGAHAYNGWGIDAHDNWSHAGALTTGTASLVYRGSDQIEWAIVFDRLPMRLNGGMQAITAFFNTITGITTILESTAAWPATDLFNQ
jgi:CubicO group peptidase (beta-lactamase class C family)